MDEDIRIREALENAEKNIAYLATMPDKKLEEKLELIYIQSEIALQKKITSSIKLLEIWRSQVIAARIYKAENNIADVPTEIEEFMAEAEFMEKKSKERIKALKKTEEKPATLPEKVNESQNIQKENKPPARNADEQLSFF